MGFKYLKNPLFKSFIFVNIAARVKLTFFLKANKEFSEVTFRYRSPSMENATLTNRFQASFLLLETRLCDLFSQLNNNGGLMPHEIGLYR